MPLSDKKCLEILMQWRVRLTSSAWLILKDFHLAEDIFQNIALKSMTRDVSFESESALVSWAFITARHESIDWIRKHHREQPSFDIQTLELLESEWIHQPHPSGASRMEALQECLEKVPDDAKKLLTLRYAEGHSCLELADHLGFDPNVIYKRISRLHIKLKACIEGKLRRADSPAATDPSSSSLPIPLPKAAP